MKVLKFFMLILMISSCNNEDISEKIMSECSDEIRITINSDFLVIEDKYEIKCYTTTNSISHRTILDFNFDNRDISGLNVSDVGIYTNNLNDGDYQIVNNVRINEDIPEGKGFALIQTWPSTNHSEIFLSQSGTISVSQNSLGQTVKCLSNVMFISVEDSSRNFIASATIVCK